MGPIIVQNVLRKPNDLPNKGGGMSDKLDQIIAIPPNSFVIIRTSNPDDWLLRGKALDAWKSMRLQGGIITDLDTKIEFFSDEELAQMGLRKIPKVMRV